MHPARLEQQHTAHTQRGLMRTRRTSVDERVATAAGQTGHFEVSFP